MRSIIHFFAKEHLLGNLITFLLIFVGIFSLVTIRRDIWPNVDFEVTSVVTTLQGASPDQIETLIVNPIEEALREVDGIKKVTSKATENTAVVIVQLDPDSRDALKTNRDIRQVIDAIDSFPEDATDPVVTEANTDLSPIIDITVSGGKDYQDNRFAAKHVYEKLSQVKGVGKVTKIGYEDREVHVVADPVKMVAKNVSLSDIVNTVKGNNISLPGGETYSEKNSELLIRTESEYKTTEQISRTVINANESGFATTIGDVADVSESYSTPSRMYKSNGQASINMLVSKKLNSDALTLIETIKSRIVEISKELGGKYNLGYSRDLSIFLSTRLETLRSNLFLGLFLVVLVLSIFLPWQVTLVVSAGIPLALLTSITFAHLSGGSLNLISLIGLIIVLGMLVDDAIVVSENIWRHVEEGKPLKEAVVDGASEVFGPVIASVLTTVCAFAPMLFMSGIFGKFIYEIPFMVILALVISLFEAFIIMPSHFVSWVGPFIELNASRIAAGHKKEKKRTWYDRLVERYSRFITWSLQSKYIMLSIAIGIFISTVGLLKATGRFVLFPAEGEQYFFVQLESPKGTSLEQMAKNIIPIEEAIQTIPKHEIQDFVSIVGIIQQDENDPQTRRGTNYANIRVTLTAAHTRARASREITNELREKIKDLPHFDHISIEMAKEGPPQGRAISINVIGKDFTLLKELANQVADELKKHDGVIDVRDSFIEGKDEWQVLPKRSELASVGLNSLLIAQSVRAAFAGIPASSIRDFDEELDILVKQKKDPGPIVDQLKSIKVGNNIGNLVKLETIADFKVKETVNSITHIDFDRIVNVSADVVVEKITAAEVISKVDPILKALVENKPGYEIKYGGESEDTEESMKSLARAFAFAGVSILFLLIATFRSLIQPILILTSIPLGFIGVTIGMFLHNRPFSFMGMLGVIALAGVIVNNSIVLIDFVNKLRQTGVEATDSIIQAATVRIRPIILTTTTTVSGLLPTAYGGFLFKTFGVGGNDPFIVPLALALAWGLAFGSVLTVLFMPSFIAITDDLKRFPLLFKRKNKGHHR